MKDRDIKRIEEYLSKYPQEQFSRFGFLGHYAGIGGDIADLKLSEERVGIEEPTFSFMAFMSAQNNSWLKYFSTFPEDTPTHIWYSTIYDNIRTQGSVTVPLYVVPIDFSISSEEFIEKYFNIPGKEKFISVLENYKKTVEPLRNNKFGDIVEGNFILENYTKFDFMQTWASNHVLCINKQIVGNVNYLKYPDTAPYIDVELARDIREYLSSLDDDVLGFWGEPVLPKKKKDVSE